jgi:hypothetical protein
MADVELMALTTEVGVHHRTVTRGHGVSDGAGLTFCGEGGLGLTPFFRCSLSGNYCLPNALSRQYLVSQAEVYLWTARLDLRRFTCFENFTLSV